MTIKDLEQSSIATTTQNHGFKKRFRLRKKHFFELYHFA